MGSGDIGIILVAGMVLVGGIYLINSGALEGFGAPQELPPDEQESTTDLEEQDAQPELEPMPVEIPVPVFIPTPGLSRKSICRRQPPYGFGGSCNSECRNHGMNSSICRTCISYCGLPVFEAPRPRVKPVPRKFPRSGRECPRGQRYNWQKRKCEVVAPRPKPSPNETPSTTPTETTPTAPATSSYARGGYY